MNTAPATLQQLHEIQQRVRTLVQSPDKSFYKEMFHPDLSPAGWHFGHCLFIENYWIREIIQNNQDHTADDHQLYFPENTSREKRGALLMEMEHMLEFAAKQQTENLQFLRNIETQYSTNELFKNEYIQKFLIQHYCQHYESMIMVKTQQAIMIDDSCFKPDYPLRPARPQLSTTTLKSGTYKIGGCLPQCYDNELPQRNVNINNIQLSTRPVNNSEYLMFMESGAYDTPSLWSQDGWRWVVDNRVTHPNHWQKNQMGNWYGINDKGACSLNDTDPVYGINHYEASAYANWVEQKYEGACLPHENEWEVAAQKNLLPCTGQVWEWCRNSFFAYEGFKAFPYDNYSSPWFDGKHYTLKGGSTNTQDAVRRHSFRNFYTAEKRHIFAGLRLAFIDKTITDETHPRQT